MRELNRASIGSRIQDANTLHRRRAVEPPMAERFMSRPYDLYKRIDWNYHSAVRAREFRWRRC
jgi:hypothetical protein